MKIWCSQDYLRLFHVPWEFRPWKPLLPLTKIHMNLGVARVQIQWEEDKLYLTCFFFPLSKLCTPTELRARPKFPRLTDTLCSQIPQIQGIM